MHSWEERIEKNTRPDTTDKGVKSISQERPL